jgi:hypothetical protein
MGEKELAVIKEYFPLKAIYNNIFIYSRMSAIGCNPAHDRPQRSTLQFFLQFYADIITVFEI